MTNVEALKALYIALGGDAADVENATTIVEVLNAIAAKYEGADDAVLNPDAIANIAAVADNISGGGGGASYAFTSLPLVTVKDDGETLYAKACCYNPVDDNGTFHVIFNHDTIGAAKDAPDPYGNNAILSQPATKIIVNAKGVPGGVISFTPSPDFDGIYNKRGEKLTLSGATIVPGDLKTYTLDYSEMSETYFINVYDGLIKNE